MSAILKLLAKCKKNCNLTVSYRSYQALPYSEYKLHINGEYLLSIVEENISCPSDFHYLLHKYITKAFSRYNIKEVE